MLCYNNTTMMLRVTRGNIDIGKRDHVMLDQADADAPASLSQGIKVCGSLDGLAAITEGATELVIWERALPAGLQAWLDELNPAILPHVRMLVEPCDLRRAMEPEMDACGLLRAGMRDVLLDDIQALVETFAAITSSDLVDVRLDRIDDDACWKFHRDSVEARLLLTYRGPATEWVEMAHAERAIEQQTNYDGPLNRLGDGDVALFKGNCAGQGSGIVHRSPPIEGSGRTRLLLCLNQPSIVSPPPWAER